MAKSIIEFIWKFDLIFKKHNPKMLVFLHVMGACLIGYMSLYPFSSDPNKVKESLVDNKDIILFGLYVVVILGGILYNSNSLGAAFYKNTASAFVVVLGRTIVLILAELLLLFIVKFFGMIIFKIPPMAISEHNHFADMLWYYPLIQLPFYFFEYRKFYPSLKDKKLS